MSSISEKVDDRLSGLPEDILSHVLSLMPTTFAVRTSVLSKRWRYSWMFVTNLDFDDIHPSYNKKTLSKFVDRVMETCKSSQIKLFRLHFSTIWVERASVSSWIDKAVKLNVRELDIRVLDFELPSILFSCKTLTKLRIDSGHRNSLVWRCTCRVNLPCLKALAVTVRNNPFVNAFELIRGCPILESLFLKIRKHKKEEEDYIFNIPTLKRLKLTLQEVCTSITKKVVLNVPNLEYLFVRGMLGSLFVMEDLSSLVEVSVSFHCIQSDDMYLEFLKGISGVKSLSMQFPPTTSALPIFPNMKHLEFTRFLYSGLVLQFLERCPELKHLCITKLTAYHWFDTKLVPACILTNLTTIKISNCKELMPDTKFLEYMSRNAKVLKRITYT